MAETIETEKITEKVRKIIADQLGVEMEQLKEEDSLQKDLNIDSLDALEIVMEAEEAFNITISDEEAERLTTVGEIIKYIESKVQKETNTDNF